MADRLMLLDTASLYFRSFYGVPTSIKAPDGTPVNAVRGLADFISRLVSDHRPTALIAAWDNDWRPQFRVDLVPSYKAHRVATDAEDVPDELSVQVPIISELLALSGICRIGVDGFEADDVIATLATLARCPVVIVTGDRDLFQLVDDTAPVRVLYTASRGVGRAELIDNAAVRSRYGVDAAQYADLALLRGDPSDGLPGVKGVGEKTAAKLLNQYGTVEALVAAVTGGSSGLSPAVRRNVVAGLPYLDQARTVVDVVRDVPLPDFDPMLPARSPDPEALARFADRWGLSSSVHRLTTALGWS